MKLDRRPSPGIGGVADPGRLVTASVVLLTMMIVRCTGIAADSPLIVAHRGASHEAPENTLAAFELAWQLGADGIEGDFHLTADRQIVCIHDADTRRTTGSPLIVESSTLAALKALDAGAWKHPKYTGQSVPTLAEVLASVPRGKRFVIELKSDQRIVPVLHEELRRADRNDIDYLIISFDEATVAACKRHLPGLRVHWLCGIKPAPTASTYQPTADQIAAVVRRTGADGVGLQGVVAAIDPAFVASLRRGGCDEFHVWTIDDADDATYFRDLGAAGITTNRVATIAAAVRAADAK